MPNLDTPDYYPPRFLRGAHLETIGPNLSRRRFRVDYERERTELEDGDFLDLDFVRSPNADTCLLVLHGLEGSSTAPYVKSLAKAASDFDWDFAAMNMRGCSGEMNRVARFYHSGETGDLRAVIQYLEKRYERIAIVGFSLGGNVVLKYLGEAPGKVSSQLLAGVAVSAPVDLQGSALRIGEAGNRVYMRRFIRLLAEKIEAKAALFPHEIDAKGCRGLPDFRAFDGMYTAPLNGFSSAEDYWQRCSSLNWLADIRLPTLLLNARNDPFLTESCFPAIIAKESSSLYSLFPDNGGHLGFPSWRSSGRAWHESVILDFIQDQF